MKVKKDKISLGVSTVWLFFAKVAGFFFSFLLPFLVVRILEKNEFGIYQQSFLVIMTIASVFSLNFGMSAYYFLPREPENGGKIIAGILGFNFLAGGAAFGGLIFFPNVLGYIFPESAAEFTALAPYIGAVSFFWLFSNFLEHVPVANQEPKTATVFIIASNLTKTVLMVSAVLIFGSVEALLIAALIQTFLQTVILLFYLNARFPDFWTAFDFRAFSRQFGYSLPYGLAGLIYIIQMDIHKYFVGFRFTAADYAIYAVGCFSIPLIGLLGEAANSTMIPRMSELQSKKKYREMLELAVRFFEKLSLIYFPLYIFLFLTANEFIVTLFTEKYRAAATLFAINITLLPFDALITDAITRSFGELGKAFLKIRIALVGILIGTLYFGIQSFTLRDMILVVVIFNLAERLITLLIVARKLEVKRSDWRLLKNVGKTAFATAIAAIPTFILHSYAVGLFPLLILIICAAVFGVVYVGAVFWLKILPEDETKMLLRQLERFRNLFGIRNAEPKIQN